MKKLFVFIFAIGWTLVMSELYIRVFDPQPMLPRYVAAGPYGIRGNMPNATYVHKTPDYRVTIHTNSRGMRSNQEYSYSKPKNVLRIVVLGDSFGMGYGVNFKDSFTEQLKDKLQIDTKQKVDIINLSVSGYGTAEELLALENEGVKYHPDVVLLSWHVTDYDDNVRSALFELKDTGGLVIKNKTYLPGVKVREFLFDFKIYRWLAGDSQLYNWIRGRAASAVKRYLLAIRKAKENIYITPKLTSPEMDDTSKAKTDYAELLSISLLRKIQEVSVSVDAKLIILDIPTRISRESFKSSIPKAVVRDFNVVEPIPTFEKYKGKLLYWEQSHGHFTPLGCMLTGGLLAKKIEELLSLDM